MTITPELLKSFAPFSSLTPQYLDKALGKVVVREFLRGAPLFKTGELLSESYFLLKGTVEVLGANFRTAVITDTTDDRTQPLNLTAKADATATAKSRVQVLAIEREFLDLLLTWSQSGDYSSMSLRNQQIAVNDSDDGDWMSSLLQSHLLSKVPPSNIQKLFALFETVQYKAGDFVIREGEHGDFFYVIESGSAQVVSKGSKMKAKLSPGHYFGEEALVGDTLRNASVVMLSDGCLMRIDKAVFTHLLLEPNIRYLSFGDVVDAGLNQILDVRLPVEHRNSSVPGSINIPLGRLRKQLLSMPEGTRLVVTDDGGGRSRVAAHLLCQAGFESYILQDADKHYA